MKRLLTPAAVVAVALGVAACGSSGSNDSATPGSTASTDTVAVKSVDGVGKVLVDANGMALYTSNRDAGGMPACDGACTTFWKPLTVASGTPTAASGAGKVSVVTRADGMRQVEVNGKPVYTFTQDSPGKVTGNGVSDAFAGKHFTRTAEMASGSSGSSGTSGSNRGGYSGGGEY
jgi:predicted lipoprotein with Yx(FWY)xxD motif